MDEDLNIRELHILRYLKGKTSTFDEIKNTIGVCALEAARILRDLEKNGIITESWKINELEEGKVRLEKIYSVTQKQSHYKKWFSVISFSRIRGLCPDSVNMNRMEAVCLL